MDCDSWARSGEEPLAQTSTELSTAFQQPVVGVRKEGHSTALHPRRTRRIQLPNPDQPLLFTHKLEQRHKKPEHSPGAALVSVWNQNFALVKTSSLTQTDIRVSPWAKAGVSLLTSFLRAANPFLLKLSHGARRGADTTLGKHPHQQLTTAPGEPRCQLYIEVVPPAPADTCTQ